MPLPRRLSYAHLRNRHPDHDAVYWQECRALLSGGRRLLRDAKVLEALFPQHPQEEEEVYAARKKRALYIPYPGEIVGDFVGQLAQDPVAPTAEPTPDPFYTDVFFEDVNRKGMTLTAYVQTMVREALTVQRAWALVDLPPLDAAVEGADADADGPATLKDEEAQGRLRAWVTPLGAECVTDWEEDDDGVLLWACVYYIAQRRTDPGADRASTLEVFTFYDDAEWVRFEVAYPNGKPPPDKEEFSCARHGTHTFQAVPLVRLTVPEGLWALDKLHSVARAHFNQRSALSYSQNKGLFPVLAAFLGPEMAGGGRVPSQAQENPSRATDQTHGIGRTVVFGKDDDLRYISPDPGVYVFAGSDLDKLRDEMHRVTATMAASVDNTPSAVGRSGESKKQDKSDKELVLQALGQLGCDHLTELLKLVATGRKDPEDYTWNVRGLRQFDQVSADDAIAQAQLVEGLTLPSPTFHKVFRASLAKRIVAHDATAEQLEDIEQEIEKNTTEEEFAAQPPLPPPRLPPGTTVPGLPPGTPGVVPPPDPASKAPGRQRTAPPATGKAKPPTRTPAPPGKARKAPRA